MNKSESIAKLALALSKAQGELNDVFKDKKGYGYNYADLASVLNVVRPVIYKHELSLTQLTGSADDKVTVETVLMHSSGEFISSEISMPVHVGKGMSHAQAVGSVITYARRYSLTAIVGIAQTDDDAALNPKATGEQVASLVSIADEKGVPLDKVLAHYGANSVNELTADQANSALTKLSKTKSKKAEAKAEEATN